MNNQQLTEERQWNKEDCSLAIHRQKVFYKTDGLLPYDIRKGLLYETPNWELVNELERRIISEEINLPTFIKYLESKRKENG